MNHRWLLEVYNTDPTSLMPSWPNDRSEFGLTEFSVLYCSHCRALYLADSDRDADCTPLETA